MLIAVGLGQYTGSGYSRILTIALYNALVTDTHIGWKNMAIYQQQLWPHLQGIYGAVHSPEGCPQDVYAVYLGHIGTAHGPCHCLLLYNGPQCGPLCFGELFTVIQQRVVKVMGQYYRRRKYRPGKAPTACLVAPGLYNPRCIAWQQHGCKCKGLGNGNSKAQNSKTRIIAISIEKNDRAITVPKTVHLL
jgi:hypothetical protein